MIYINKYFASLRIAFSLLSLIITIDLSAQIITDRPDQTESATVVPVGSLQIESGLQLSYEESGGISAKEISSPTTLFRYGLTSAVELRLVHTVSSGYIGTDRLGGIQDIEIGTKIALSQNSEAPVQIALLSHIVLPSGSSELRGDQWASVNKLSIAHDVTDDWSIGYNVGYDYAGEGNGDITYSIALGHGINDRVAIYIEPYGAIQDISQWIVNADTGFTYLIHPNLQLDFSFGVGVNQRMNYVAVGASWLIE